MGQPGSDVPLKGFVPFSPDAPVGEAPFAQPGQQAVICHPGYELQALQQGVLGDVISQGWVIQYVAISVCIHTGGSCADCLQLGLPSYQDDHAATLTCASLRQVMAKCKVVHKGALCPMCIVQ
jgi:hypothetical protein